MIHYETVQRLHFLHRKEGWTAPQMARELGLNVKTVKHWLQVEPFVPLHYAPGECAQIDWGHVVVRMCGYPPFGAQVILNGHEWVDLKARHTGPGLARDDNSFVDADTYERVNCQNTQLEREVCLKAVCDRWLYSACVCFGLSRQEQQATNFVYRYSIFQLELSRNYLFAKGSVPDEVYQQLLDRTRSLLDVERLKTIFGSRQRPRIHIAKARNQQRGRRAAEVGREVRRWNTT